MLAMSLAIFWRRRRRPVLMALALGAVALSPAYAELQVGRVATARGVSPDRVRALVAQGIRQPTLGVIGEPRVNVLLLNLALDRTFGAGSG